MDKLIDVKKLKEQIKEKSFIEEIFDEDVFNATYSENYTREEAEDESFIETSIVKTDDVLQLIDDAPKVNPIVIPEGTTLGDIVRAMFSKGAFRKVTVLCGDEEMWVYGDPENYFHADCTFKIECWNAPIKKEDKSKQMLKDSDQSGLEWADMPTLKQG